MCNAYNHPPGCRCGWGGEGHLGQHYLGGSRSVAPVHWPSDDFCRPTICPICGSAQVWFIRHNGGSIWVDSPGAPWPIHPCFEKDRNSSELLRQLAGLGLSKPRHGIITRAKRNLVLGGLDLDLAWGAGKTARLRCRLSGPAERFLGDLVVVWAQPPALHHPTLGVSTVQWIEGGVPLGVPSLSVVPVASATPEAEFKGTAKRPLNSLNWTDEQLTEQEATVIATIKTALGATRNPTESRERGQRLVLAEIRKLPRHLRNLLLQRFEKNKWRQLTLLAPENKPPIPEWRRRLMKHYSGGH